MGRFSENSHGQLRTVHEINITPLMDLTFMLLIVFMITAPVLEYESDVSPPKMETSKRTDEDLEAQVISLTSHGEIVFQKQTVTLEVLGSKLEFLRQARPDLSVTIRADGGRQYQEVVGIMRTARKAGVEHIKLATQAEAN